MLSTTYLMTSLLEEEAITALPLTTLFSNMDTVTSSSTDGPILEHQSPSTRHHFSDNSIRPIPSAGLNLTTMQMETQSTDERATSRTPDFEAHINKDSLTKLEHTSVTLQRTTFPDEQVSTQSMYVSVNELSAHDISQSSEMSLESSVSDSVMNTTNTVNSFSEVSFSITDVSTHVADRGSGDIASGSISLSSERTGESVTVVDTTTESGTQWLSSAMSSIFPNITDPGQHNLSSLKDGADLSSFPFNNLTVSPCMFCDFPITSNNATITESSPPDFYDVITSQLNVSKESSSAVLVTKSVTLGLLAVSGVMGNALVIWSVVRQRHLHRPPFYYLLSLSLTDLSRAAFCLPLVLMTLLQGSVWRHGDSACDLFAFANSFFVLSSSVSLLDIAADRHLSLVYPYSYKRRAAGAVNLVVVLLGWTLAFLVSFPPVVGVGAYAFETSEGQCTLRHNFFRHGNDTLGFLLVFSVLMLVTLFIYYRVFLSLRGHRRMKPLEHEPARSDNWSFVGPGANGQAFINWVNGFGGANFAPLPHSTRNPFRPQHARLVTLHVTRNQHVIRLFFLMTVTFTALWLPYQVLSYWRVFGSAAQIQAGVVTTAAWLSYGQVVVCPLVYFSSQAPTRRRPSRCDVSPDNKQHELLLESLHRKK